MGNQPTKTPSKRGIIIFAVAMRFIHTHISYILGHYKGEMPLSNYLKYYFKKHPILGSRDRKLISEMAYCFYRCAKGFDNKKYSQAELIDASLLLAESNLPQLTKLISEHWQSQYGKDFEDNFIFLKEAKFDFEIDKLFTNNITFSEGINKTEWLHTMLRRPRLFIHIVPQYFAEASRLLQTAEIDYEQINDHCFAFANGTTIEKILAPKMYRIQDASSQKTAAYFKMKDTETLWDCCSGAGGKALLAKDVAPHATLCVSDVRKTILDNLAERFALYGYPIPERLILSADSALQTKKLLGERRFQHIIADVPCSGSGTWARTPEQLYFFEPATLSDFAKRQKAIANNALQYLENGGTFVYITCSVFEAENEEVLQDILAHNPQITLQQQQLINGTAMGADSMFIAVLRR